MGEYTYRASLLRIMNNPSKMAKTPMIETTTAPQMLSFSSESGSNSTAAFSLLIVPLGVVGLGEDVVVSRGSTDVRIGT